MSCLSVYQIRLQEYPRNLLMNLDIYTDKQISADSMDAVLASLLAGRNPRDLHIIHDIYRDKCLIKEIASDYNVSPQCICIIRCNVLKYLNDRRDTIITRLAIELPSIETLTGQELWDRSVNLCLPKLVKHTVEPIAEYLNNVGLITPNDFLFECIAPVLARGIQSLSGMHIETLISVDNLTFTETEVNKLKRNSMFTLRELLCMSGRKFAAARGLGTLTGSKIVRDLKALGYEADYLLDRHNKESPYLKTLAMG